MRRGCYCRRNVRIDECKNYANSGSWSVLHYAEHIQKVMDLTGWVTTDVCEIYSLILWQEVHIQEGKLEMARAVLFADFPPQSIKSSGANDSAMFSDHLF